MPAHGFLGNVRYGVEGTPGSRVLEPALVDMPDWVRSARRNAARVTNETTGVGSRDSQGQNLLMRQPELEVELDVADPTFLALCLATAGVLPSLTFEVSRLQAGATLAEIWVGCLCNSLRITGAQREPLRATAQFWPLTEESDTGHAWAAPAARPFGFIEGIISSGGEVIGFDIDLDQGLIRDQYISVAPPADPYAPSYVLVGRQSLTARIRSASIYDITETENVIDVTLVFDNGINTLTIALTDGIYQGQEGNMPADAIQEFGIPIKFAAIGISNGA